MKLRSRRRLDKRGVSLAVMFLITFLATVAISTIIVTYVNSLADSDSAQKLNIAADMSMMINTLVSTPGNAVVRYPHDVSEFVISLGRSSVVVYKENNLLSVQSEYLLPFGYLAGGAVEAVDHPCLEKIGRDIILRPCHENEFES